MRSSEFEGVTDKKCLESEKIAAIQAGWGFKEIWRLQWHWKGPEKQETLPGSLNFAFSAYKRLATASEVKRIVETSLVWSLFVYFSPTSNWRLCKASPTEKTGRHPSIHCSTLPPAPAILKNNTKKQHTKFGQNFSWRDRRFCASRERKRDARWYWTSASTFAYFSLFCAFCSLCDAQKLKGKKNIFFLEEKEAKNDRKEAEWAKKKTMGCDLRAVLTLQLFKNGWRRQFSSFLACLGFS